MFLKDLKVLLMCKTTAAAQWNDQLNDAELLEMVKSKFQ